MSIEELAVDNDLARVVRLAVLRRYEFGYLDAEDTLTVLQALGLIDPDERRAVCTESRVSVP